MDRYQIYCTPKQTRKALELGAPIITVCHNYHGSIVTGTMMMGNDLIYIPTAEQMIGFLRSKGFRFHFDDATTFWRTIYDVELIADGWDENKELTAINSALEYLTNNNKCL